MRLQIGVGGSKMRAIGVTLHRVCSGPNAGKHVFAVVMTRFTPWGATERNLFRVGPLGVKFGADVYTGGYRV